GLAQEERGARGLCRTPCLVLEPADDFGPPAEGVDGGAPQRRILRAMDPHLAARFDEPAEHEEKRGELDRLREKLIGAFLNRRDRELDRSVSGEHQDRDARVDSLEGSNEIDARRAREIVVDPRDIRPPLLEDTDRLFPRRRRLHLEALPYEE